MEEISSITITPYHIIEKSKDFTLMISHQGNYKRIYDGGILMNDFNQGDYVLQGKMVGSGFVQFDYVKMSKKEIKDYFPKQPEPEDLFSKFKNTSIFKSLK